MSELEAVINDVRRIDFAKFKELAAELALVQAGCEPQVAPAKKTRMYDVTLASAFFEGTTTVNSMEELLECAEMAQYFAAHSLDNGLAADAGAIAHNVQPRIDASMPSLAGKTQHAKSAVSTVGISFLMSSSCRKQSARGCR